MKTKDFTYAELNAMFSRLVYDHRNDTEFFSAESAKEFANDELINGDYLFVQNAFDILATKVEDLKDVFCWSFGMGGYEDVGLFHKKTNEFDNDTYKMDMIMAECQRRGVAADSDSIIAILDIAKEMESVNI